MLSTWLHQHPTAPLTLWWALGAVWLGVRQSGLRARVVALVLGVAASLSGAAALDWVVSVPPIIDPFGMTYDGAWWVVCAVLLVTAQAHRTRQTLRSAVPLGVLGWLGGGALAAAVLVGAAADLEVGRHGRVALAVGILGLAGAAWLERFDLDVWLWLGQYGAGGDAGSMAITLVSAGLSGLGVGGIVRTLEHRLTAPPAQRAARWADAGGGSDMLDGERD